MPDPYRIVERRPTLQEYYTICCGVGWQEVMNFEAAETSLNNSLYCIVAEYEGKAVGMGRIVGDGAIYFYIQDVAVTPEHQGKGVGGRIMDHLLAYLKAHAPDKSFVGLFAAEGKMSFYRRYGFNSYTTLTGMFRVTPIDDWP